MKTTIKVSGKNVKTPPMLIGGKLVGARSGAVREIRDPANGELVGFVPEAAREDVKAAILAAREAFDRGPWRKSSALERGKLLLKIGDLIRADAKAFAELEVRNMGKPLAEAEYDVADAATSAPSTAASKSASANTMLGFFPPSSKVVFLRFPVAAIAIFRPVTVPPVKATLSTSGLSASSSPTPAPGPVTTLTTPAGTPAS